MLTAPDRERLLSVILGVFRDPIKHHLIGGDGNFSLRVYWHLKDDPSRKHKQSRNIYIHLTEDCIEDYSAGAQSCRLEIEKQLTAYIRRRLSLFDPSNDTPKYARPPKEDWCFRPRP